MLNQKELRKFFAEEMPGEFHGIYDDRWKAVVALIDQQSTGTSQDNAEVQMLLVALAADLPEKVWDNLSNKVRRALNNAHHRAAEAEAEARHFKQLALREREENELLMQEVSRLNSRVTGYE